MLNEDILKQFGFAVKNSRRTLGVSQEELAERAGLHRTYISDIERGQRNASLRILGRLADALRMPLSELFEPLNVSCEAHPLPARAIEAQMGQPFQRPHAPQASPVSLSAHP